MDKNIKLKDSRLLLIENDAGYVSLENNINIINEMKNIDFSDDIILYAILQKYNTPNKNGRIYPEHILKREVEKYQELIKKGGALSELNHPSSNLIDLDRVSHSIIEMWWENEVLMGKIKLFTSPGWRKMGVVSTKGDQAAMLIMNEATLGISSRGVGSLKKEKGGNVVQNDFELVCFDLVSNPSTPGAYVFADLKDKDKFNESSDIKQGNESLVLMNKLNNFLSKR